MKRLILILPLFLTGCAALTSSAPESWVRADRQTFDAVAPYHRDYIKNDATLNEDQKATNLRTVDAWETRLIEHEKSLAQPK